MSEQGAFKHTSMPWHLGYGIDDPAEPDPFDEENDVAPADADGFVITMAEARPDADGFYPPMYRTSHRVEYMDGLYPEEGGYEEAHANARLMSAAPELLALVMELLADRPIAGELRKQAESAYRKATGMELFPESERDSTWEAA